MMIMIIDEKIWVGLFIFTLGPNDIFKEIWGKKILKMLAGVSIYCDIIWISAMELEKMGLRRINMSKPQYTMQNNIIA